MMKWLAVPFLLASLSSTIFTFVSALSVDSKPMWDIAESITSPNKPRSWQVGTDPCEMLWLSVGCKSGRVTRLNFRYLDLSGTLHPSIAKLSRLQYIDLTDNSIFGPLPSFANLTFLDTLILRDNAFSSIPADFFSGLIRLQHIFLDNIPLAPWNLPSSLAASLNLTNLSACNASITGTIPDEFASLSHLANLSLSHNNLTGHINIVGTLPLLVLVQLRSNHFTGPIPDLSKLRNLHTFDVANNYLTGIIPRSLTSLETLQNVSLSNNMLQGPFPVFSARTVLIDVASRNSFCKPAPGPCDSRVAALLEMAAALGYPLELANSWRGNNPCATAGWLGVYCDAKRQNITVVDFSSRNLSGSISPHLADLTSLRRIILRNNRLQGSIPKRLTRLPLLELLDVSYNNLSGKVPNFAISVRLELTGNHFEESVFHKSNKKWIIWVATVAAVMVVGSLIACLVVYLICRCKKKKSSVAVTIPSGEMEATETNLVDTHRIENTEGAQLGLNISIEALRSATDNFSESNVLGKGGFGVVFKGELNGVLIAVKRRERNLLERRGQEEFLAEINVLTKVRHRNLVTLLGYCDANTECLLVYEYMSGGTLADRLFHVNEKGYAFLNSRQRLIIALDVARGLEYLHGLARQTFIHRDLKSSNILLDKSMRAKISDFGLVKLVVDKDKSMQTQVAGTFGYLAPEYAFTGKISTKIDVYAFGAILIELVTGQKILDDSRPSAERHLIECFHPNMINEEDFVKFMDPLLLEDVANHKNLYEMARLAHLCTMREPAHRPDMAFCVSGLTPLVEPWTPKEREIQEEAGPSSTLMELMEQWQAGESTSY